MNESPEAVDQEPAPTEAAQRVVGSIEEVMERLTSTAQVSAAFGEPRTIGDRTIIPAAEVMCGLGFGMGSGQDPGPEGRGTAGGSGGGGGGGTRTRPVAAIVVEPEGVHVQPIVNTTQIYLAALSAGLFGLFWAGQWLRTSRDLGRSENPPSPMKLARILRHQ